MPRLVARVRAVFDLRPGEGATSAWAAIAFFAILCSYFIMRPVRDAAAIEGNPDFIPWLLTATFVVMTAIAAPWGALVARVRRNRLVPISFRAFNVQLLGFVVLFASIGPTVAIGRVFYVWLSVFNLFVVSVFWSVCTDLARPEQGRRLFGPIAAGGTAGAIVGPLITRSLAHHVEPWVLLLLASVLLEGAVWAMVMVERHGRQWLEVATPAALPANDRGLDERRAARAVGGRPLTGLANLLRSPYLAGIAVYALCAACLATFIYLTQAEIAKAALPDRATRIRFFANIELWTGLATIGLQAVITSRLLRWLGVGVVLAALPLIQGVGLLALTQVSTLTMATVVSATGRAATHGLSRPGRELLFTAVDREDRFKTKNVIDTLIYRLGDTGSSWLHRGLTVAGVALTAVALPLAAAWAALALALGLGHRRRTAGRP